MRILSLIFCIFLFSTCKKDEPPKFYYGEVSVKLNGQNFVREVEAISADTNHPNSFGIWLKEIKQLSKDVSIESEILSINALKIFHKQYLKRYDFSPNAKNDKNAMFSTYLSDGDVIGDVYYINENAKTENFLEITQENSGFKEIWGNFQFEMTRDSLQKDQNSPYPDTLKFTEGKFHVYFK